MIKRTNSVMLRTQEYGFRITVEHSIMNSKELRKFLLDSGGENKRDFCWFEDSNQFWKVVNELCIKGAFPD